MGCSSSSPGSSRPGGLDPVRVIVAKRSIHLINAFRLAIEQGQIELARLYSDMIYRLMLKNRAPITVRKFICKTCHQYLLSTKTARIRKHGPFLVFTCLNCQRPRKHYLGSEEDAETEPTPRTLAQQQLAHSHIRSMQSG